MISPEIIRRYTFFTGLTAKQYRSLAMLAEKENLEIGSTIFEEGQSANKFFILVEGNVELYIKSEEFDQPSTRRDFFVGEINPGDVFGISAVLEPYTYTATAKAANTISVIEFDALSLRDLMQENCKFGFHLMHQIAKALLFRLNASRIQLAAAWD